MVIGGIGNWLLPGFGAAIAARGGSTVVQNSIFRSAYEVLFTPVVPERKRSTKAIIDVGFERLGDATGAGIVQGVLAIAPALVSGLLSWGAIGLGLLGLYAARRLHQGYVRTLEENLESRAEALGESALLHGSTHETVMQSLTSVSLSEEIRQALDQAPAPGPAASPGPLGRVQVVRPEGAAKTPSPTETGASERPTETLDPLMRQIAALRSRDPKKVIPLLSNPTPLPVELAGHLIPLLAWNEISERVVQALRKMAPRVVGQLGDALVFKDSEFAVRRRLPRVLEACEDPRGVESLLRGLEDRRFEVRYQCGRALARIQKRNGDLEFSMDRVFSLVENEVDVDRSVWESHRLLDQLPTEERSPFEDRFLEKRASRSLEHVFTVLSLALPTDPLMISYRGLHTNDRQLRGTALEYLENVLPLNVRRKLWPFLEVELQPKTESRTREQILRQLMDSNESIEINLKELRDEHRRRDKDPD